LVALLVSYGVSYRCHDLVALALSGYAEERLPFLRNLRLPVALILPAGLVLAELLMLLSARYAKAPEPTFSFIERQAQKALVALHA
jgi:hypothetical protein